MKSGCTVSDAMTLRPVTAPPHTSVHDVAQMMERQNVGSVLITSGGKVRGLVTERDFVTRLCLGGYNPVHTPVTSIMSRDLITVTPSADLFDALRLMRDAEIRHLPVMTGEKLEGFVTAKDILKLQPHLFENFVDLIQLREEPRKMSRTSATIDFEDME